MKRITEEEDNAIKIKLRSESGKSLRISGRPNSEPNVKLSLNLGSTMNSTMTSTNPKKSEDRQREKEREKEKVIFRTPRKSSSPLKSIFKIKMKKEMNNPQTQPLLPQQPTPIPAQAPPKEDLRKKNRTRAKSTPKTARDNISSSKKIVLKPNK